MGRRKDKITAYDDGQDHAINSLDTDYKAEVVAAGFVENGFDPERTLILRQGSSHRGFAKDIENVHVDFSQVDLADYLYINTNRSGIYDSLPEVMFHSPFQGERKRTKEAVLKEIAQHRMEEFNARKMFRPIETAIDYCRVFIQLHEREIDKKNQHRNYVNIFTPYWWIIKLLPLHQAVYFMNAIPIMQEINNNFSLMSQVMSGTLGMPVSVKRGKLSTIEYTERDGTLSRLGRCKLGRSMILGTHFKDGCHNIVITVGPMQRDKVEYFVKDADGDKILKALVDMIIPCDRDVEIKFDVEKLEATFTLAGIDKPGSRLGINTVLKKTANKDVNYKTETA